MHSDAAERLLAWYDHHARVLPWRIGPDGSTTGQRPDPYHVWLSEIMLQQTTVKAVQPYFARFLERWPTVEALAGAEDAAVMAEWAGLGYYARARNLLKCARAVTALGGFPASEEALRDLPGIGRYTSAAIAAIAFGERAVVVDGNVERVIARRHSVAEALPAAKPRIHELADMHTPTNRPGDYAQAMMDLGATICTLRNPVCPLCPLSEDCSAHAEGDPTRYPRKTPKKAKPVRYGIAYVVRRPDGSVLLETRPDSGLLGGTLGVPGTEWTQAAPEPAPPCAATWSTRAAPVRHVFTHFSLELAVQAAEVQYEARPRTGAFQIVSPDDLPTVMRKALLAGIALLDEEDGS